VPANPIVLETLAAIEAERGGPFDRSFALAHCLLAEFGEADLAERLYAAIPADCPWEIVADLFGILQWSTQDNGAALSRAMEGWLQAGQDLRKIRIALFQDSYPFLDCQEMERVLRDVTAQYPEVAGRCGELIESRRRLPE
jgi:hypothetical protein